MIIQGANILKIGDLCINQTQNKRDWNMKNKHFMIVVYLALLSEYKHEQQQYKQQKEREEDEKLNAILKYTRDTFNRFDLEKTLSNLLLTLKLSNKPMFTSLTQVSQKTRYRVLYAIAIIMLLAVIHISEYMAENTKNRSNEAFLHHYPNMEHRKSTNQ